MSGSSFGVCLRLVGNRADAEDITQDVMLKVFGKLATFAGRSSFKTWLVRVTRNACKDWLKKEGNIETLRGDRWRTNRSRNRR